MNHRLGTCSSCKAQYKVPASFQADRAKCKACGGVVEIGPVGGAAPATAKPASTSAPRSAAHASAPPAKPVPARPVAAAAPRTAAPAPKPVVEEKDSVRVAAAAAAERVRAAGRKGAAEPSEAAKHNEGARERSKARAGAGAKSGAGRRAARKDKEKSKAPMLAAVLVLLVAGGGGAWFLTRGDDGSQAAEKAATEGDLASAPAVDASEQAQATPEAAQVETAPEPEDAAPTAQEGGGSDAPVEKPAAKPADEDLDLSVYPDEPKLPGTSDADWASIQEWTNTFLDANAGAAGNRARGKLIERGREAFPAMLNAMKRLDFSTDDGFRAGDLAQRFLMDVCNGQNFDWRYGTEPADVLFNKKVVRSWIKAWEQGRETPKAWAKLSKTTEEEATKLFAVTGPFDAAGEGSSSDAASASSALDDL